MDAVVHCWILLMAVGAGGQDRRRREVIHRVTLFYVDEFLVASTELVYLQGEFDTLTGLFDRSGIWKNIGNMVGMLCRPCHVVGNQ